MKKLQALSKNAKIHDRQNVANHSITNRKYAVIYHQTLYQTLEEVLLAPF